MQERGRERGRERGVEILQANTTETRVWDAYAPRRASFQSDFIPCRIVHTDNLYFKPGKEKWNNVDLLCRKSDS